jgi:hypothetical protein
MPKPIRAIAAIAVFAIFIPFIVASALIRSIKGGEK